MKRILISLAIIAFASCSKETPEPVDPRDCAKNNQGNVYVDNRTGNPYKVWINGTDKGTVAANSRILVPVRYDKGIPVKVIQESGYILTPDQRAGNVDVEICGESLFRIQ